MSHATVTPASGQPSLDEFLTAASKLLAASITGTRVILQQAAGLFPRPPDLTALRRPDMCAIPETECPPRCVCVVSWEASPGETPALTLRVRNASKVARTFTVSATPFTGAAGSPGTIALQPASLSLPPGHSDVVNGTFAVPEIDTGDYEAEILVEGAYDQCVRVILKVRSQKTCGDDRCTCEVVQGDPPVRIRAHHWYDHFQCTEPCGERRGTLDRDPYDDHG
jgi:hypothetical protein